MKILGISAFYHDSAAAIVVDGKILAAAQEERFTRKKHDAGFPVNATKFCLEYSGLKIDDLDAVVFYDKPLLKFERLLETYQASAPKGWKQFVTSMPLWLKEKLFIKKLIKDELKKVGEFDSSKVKLLFPDHHLSHAASTFFVSPFSKSAILTIDGVGEWTTASICLGEGNSISVLKEMHFPHSVGLLYSAFTYFLGFKVNSGEYKLMGLAPYAIENSEQVLSFIATIKQKIVQINNDGSIWLDQQYFSYATDLRMVPDGKWKTLFGFGRRNSDEELQQHHCNLALAIQQVTEEIVLKLAKHAKEITGADYLCLSGGVALNCVANGKIEEQEIFKQIFITPASGDAGGALGAALAAYHIYFSKPRIADGKTDLLSGSYLGTEFSDFDVQKTIRQFGAPYMHFENEDELCKKVAEVIAEGNVVGWHNGRMEFGPRALGARSIIGDPRNEDMQKKLNLKIKYRESFRPFAPSVLAENASEYFDLKGDSPYMLLVHPITKSIRKEVPTDYSKFDMRQKLYCSRSALPSITHVDFSARIQTVHRETNPRYWKLISAFKELTGCAVLVNTSFNVRGEPIVNTPEDAYRCFMRTQMDYLVVGNFLFAKTEQPLWNDTDKWKEEFTLD
jgi:carbamoyltransferase